MKKSKLILIISSLLLLTGCTHGKFELLRITDDQEISKDVIRSYPYTVIGFDDRKARKRPDAIEACANSKQEFENAYENIKFACIERIL